MRVSNVPSTSDSVEFRRMYVIATRAWAARSELGANEGDHSDRGSLQGTGTRDLNEITSALVLEAVTPFSLFLVARRLITAISLKIDFRDDTFYWVAVRLGVGWLDGGLQFQRLLGSFFGKYLPCCVLLGVSIIGVGAVLDRDRIDHSLVDCIRFLNFLCRRVLYNIGLFCSGCFGSR